MSDHLKLMIGRRILKIFYIFPIKRKRIFFSSYEGKSFSCNPKYIYCGLENLKLDYIWELNKDIDYNGLKKMLSELNIIRLNIFIIL